MGDCAQPKHLKKCRNWKLNWIFQRGGWEVLEKFPSVGKVWIFPGTTRFEFKKNVFAASYNLDFYES